ncbi:MAG: DUF2062 domain-containing protein [Rhizobacter sp.]|nr:DUF2062 domain-containing protein [Rhizobacter sp.]
MRQFRKFLPSPDTIQRNRWLRWLGPSLQHPRVWHFSRRGLALGMALGIFFGLLLPIAQIPLSAAAAVVLRANLPAAVASTLVTNPLTFGPVYYVAWRVGGAILGEASHEGQLPPQPQEVAPAPADESWYEGWLRRVLGVGKPLVLGLSVLAVTLSVATYFLVSWLWMASVYWRRRRHRA